MLTTTKTMFLRISVRFFIYYLVITKYKVVSNWLTSRLLHKLAFKYVGGPRWGYNHIVIH